MAMIPSTPEPGFYEFETPIGWESDSESELINKTLGYTEDPVLKAMRLEAEAEQYDEYLKSRGPMKERAKKIKNYLKIRRQLQFNQDPKSISALSISSYDTDDFMSEPSMSIHELQGEAAWLTAYKAKAQQRKKLRKLIAGSDNHASPVKPKAKSPVKVKMPSPAKIAQAYASQSPAIQQAVAAVLATPKKFGDIVLDSDDEDYMPPTKVTKPLKKKFFAEPTVDSPSPIKTPSPFKVKTNFKKKTFFAPPTVSP